MRAYTSPSLFHILFSICPSTRLVAYRADSSGVTERFSLLDAVFLRTTRKTPVTAATRSSQGNSILTYGWPSSRLSELRLHTTRNGREKDPSLRIAFRRYGGCPLGTGLVVWRGNVLGAVTRVND